MGLVLAHLSHNLNRLFVPIVSIHMPLILYTLHTFLLPVEVSARTLEAHKMKYLFQVMLTYLLAAGMVMVPATAYASGKRANSGATHHRTRTYHNHTPRAHVHHVRTHHT